MEKINIEGYLKKIYQWYICSRINEEINFFDFKSGQINLENLNLEL